MNRFALVALSAVLLILSCSCGGGGGGGGSTTVQQPPPGLSLQITTDSLPDAIQGRSYSQTLSAVNGVGTLKWAILPINGQQFITGLSVDPSTGVLSGSPNFSLIANFTAQVTDAQGRVATKDLRIIGDPALSVPPSTDTQVNEYSDLFNGIRLNFLGGAAPYTVRVTGGKMPPGLRIQPHLFTIIGSAFQLGTYSATVEISDSASPPEVGTQQVNITVLPASLTVANSLPSRLPLNLPFSGRVVVRGGTPPYKFSATGLLPPGMTVDPSTGQFSGTPTQANLESFTVQVSDSGTPVQNASQLFVITVDAPRGRNDSPATATPVTAGAAGTFSPYIDPPDKAATVFDTDYYKVQSAAGLIVTLIATSQQALVDPVLEIVDANGIRYGNCRQPGDTSTNFTSICMNDDISVSPHNTNSSLDFQVPGTPGSVTTFYAHVFDWRGDSRPDMTYGFGVSGAALPLAIPPFAPQTGTIGAPYGQALNASGGLDPYTWTVDSGSLPPGIILQNFTGAFGFLTGMPTTAGKFPFTLKVTDGTNPKQSATVALSIDVSTPLVIASAATFPDACVNQPYSFQISATGGTPPFAYILGFFGATTGLAIDKNTGLIAGIPTATGTFPGFVQAFDSVGRATQQIVGLTVKTCP